MIAVNCCRLDCRLAVVVERDPEQREVARRLVEGVAEDVVDAERVRRVPRAGDAVVGRPVGVGVGGAREAEVVEVHESAARPVIFLLVQPSNRHKLCTDGIILLELLPGITGLNHVAPSERTDVDGRGGIAHLEASLEIFNSHGYQNGLRYRFASASRYPAN